MADANLTSPPPEGETLFGTNQPGIVNGLGLRGGEVHDEPTYLTLTSTASGGTTTTYYLWVDGTGDLRIGSGRPGASGFDQDADGAIVGVQA